MKGIRTEVIEHSSDPPSPWAGYLRCMEKPPRCSHLLIVQDDARPVPGFAPAVKSIAKAQPETPVCLFLGRLPRDASAKAERAQKTNVRYIELSRRSFLPVVAVLWPRHKLVEFHEWALKNPYLFGRVDTRSDDAMAGRWKLVTRQRVLCAVPSIVEHPDDSPSTVGRTQQWGKARARSAALLASDATIVDWSRV